MAKKTSPSSQCAVTCGSGLGLAFKVESIVSVDERGQMVLPKEVRERAGIRPGDKLALVVWEKEGAVCCVSLIKTDAFSGMIKSVLGPMVQELAKS